MGKYMSIIIGGVIAIIGLIGLINWWGAFVTLLKGSIPAMMIFGGVIAVIAGMSEMKDEAAAKKPEEQKQG